MGFVTLLKMTRLLKVDSKNGQMFIEGRRVMIIPVEFSSALNKGLAKVVGKGAASALYNQGKEIGNSIFDLFIRIKGIEVKYSEDDYKRAIEDFLPLGGFGRMELTELDFKSGEVVLRGWNFPEVISIGHSEEPVCHLMRGISTRFTELVLQRPLVGKEVKCQAKGDEYCEILINSGDE